jgi:CrcB protein
VSLPPLPRPGLRPVTVAVVALGGLLGALARVAVGQAWPVDVFPWSTLAVNVSGTAVLAFLPALAVVHRRPLLAPFLGTGAMGGYTTLSTASAETVALGDGGRPLLARVYGPLTLAACGVAVALGDRFSTGPQGIEFERDEGDL